MHLFKSIKIIDLFSKVLFDDHDSLVEIGLKRFLKISCLEPYCLKLDIHVLLELYNRFFYLTFYEVLDFKPKVVQFPCFFLIYLLFLLNILSIFPLILHFVVIIVNFLD